MRLLGESLVSAGQGSWSRFDLDVGFVMSELQDC